MAPRYTIVTFAAVLLSLWMFAGRSRASEIGSTVYLPDTNLGSTKINPLPLTLFQGDVSRYLQNQSLTIVNNHARFRDTAECVYNELASTFSLSGPTEVLQLSFSTTFRTITGGKSDVSSSLVLVESYARRLYIRSEAQRSIQLLPLRNDFLQELRSLPNPPSGNAGWEPYDAFLRRWGSHYMSEILYGSWLRVWSTARSTSSYTERQIQARACAELTGNTPLSIVQGCAGVSREDMTAASRLDMSTLVEVRGGEPDTAAELSVRRTDALIESFIEQGRRSDTAEVRYAFRPIWEPVLATYPNSASKEWRVATALEAYYNGLLAFECPERNLATPFTVLQMFRQRSTGLYECVRRCQGCRTNSDCNLHSGGCYCYGNSCISVDEDGRPTVQPRRDNKPVNEEPNRSCYYDFPNCRCRSESREENCKDNYIAIWDQLEDGRAGSGLFTFSREKEGPLTL